MRRWTAITLLFALLLAACGGSDKRPTDPPDNGNNPPAVIIEVETPPSWTVDVGTFESNMTAVLSLEIDGKVSFGPEDRLAAFVDGQLRGLVAPLQVEGSERSLFFMTIHSNQTSGEEISFSLYDDAQGRIYQLGQRLAFVVDSHHGSIDAPLGFSAAGAP